MSKLNLIFNIFMYVGLALEHANCAAFSIDQKEYQTLYKLGEPLTDKASWHNYLEVYSHYFKQLKNEKIKFLEIGIWNGGSVVLWENYFSNAEIHAIDTTFDFIKHKFNRANIHLADQSKASDLLDLMKKTGGDFDVILDDGGHLMDQQITSFITLFPYLKKGGLYIIEDLHTSYWKDYGGSGTQQNPDSSGNTAISFLKNLIDDVNFIGASTGRASHSRSHRGNFDEIRERLNNYKEEILGIHFYDSICIVIKR